MVEISDSNSSREINIIKILILGDQAVGKTSILLRYTRSSFSDVLLPTLGVDFKQKEVIVKGKSYIVQIWDSAGQERFRSVTRTYYKKASGIILAYDCTSFKSFQNVEQWLQQITSEVDSQVPLVLVSTKNDLPRSEDLNQGKKLAKQLRVKFFRTSSKTGEGIDEVFQHIIDMALAQFSVIRSRSISCASFKTRKRRCC
jgi:small GTP-binding protein